MDPLLVLAIGSYVLRRCSRIACSEAADKYQSAVSDYRQARSGALDEQDKCLGLLNDMAEFRQAAMGSRWGRLHALLVACGMNGGVFAPPRKVFGARTEEEVRAILAEAQAMLVKGRVSPVDPLLMAKHVALLLRGIDFVDACGLVHIPVLHTPVHDVAASLEVDGLTDLLGPIGDLEVGTVLSGGLTVFSLFVSASNFAKAREMQDKSDELRREARRLDAARCELEAIGRRVCDLCGELKVTSYELFKWTVVAEECARLHQGDSPRCLPGLPGWIVKGLLRKASELWKTIEKSPFLVATAAALGD